jgi:hypothetical protein
MKFTCSLIPSSIINIINVNEQNNYAKNCAESLAQQGLFFICVPYVFCRDGMKSAEAFPVDAVSCGAILRVSAAVGCCPRQLL